MFDPSSLDPASPTAPHDDDAEALVLGALLLQPERLPEVAGLRPFDWFGEQHQLIYTALCAVSELGSPVDASTVSARLRDDDKLERAGGASYIAHLLTEVPACVRLAEHAERIRSRAEARRLILACQTTAASGYTNPDPAELRAKLAALIGDAPTPIGATAGPRLPWLYGDTIAKPLERREWAIPGLQIGAGRPAMVAAYAGSSKTIAMQSALLAYAAGRSVWGAFPTGRGGLALHIDWEQGEYATRWRYQRLAYGMGIELSELNDRLGMISMPPLYLTDPDAERKLEREIAGAQLVLLDSLRASMPGVDENASEVRRYIDILTRISERTGAAIVLIHHAGKTKESHVDARQIARGSSAILDAVGCCFVITMSKRADPRILTQVKVPADSGGSGVEDGALLIEDVQGPEGPLQGLRIVYQTSEQAGQGSIRPEQAIDQTAARILKAVAGAPSTTGRRLKALVGGSRVVVDAALEQLVQAGQIIEEKARGQAGGGGYVYRIGTSAVVSSDPENDHEEA